jgi:hypothetical protein
VIVEEDVSNRPIAGTPLAGTFGPVLGVAVADHPATPDPDLTRRWLADYAAADIGIEGLGIKALGQAYLPGRRDLAQAANPDHR